MVVVPGLKGVMVSKTTDGGFKDALRRSNPKSATTIQRSLSIATKKLNPLVAPEAATGSIGEEHKRSYISYIY